MTWSLLAHRVSRIEPCPASTEELCIGTSEKRLLYANQPQNAENDLCKQPVGKNDEDAAWKQSRRKKLQAAVKLLTLGL